MHNAIGGVELSGLAKGFAVTDAMMKTAPVELLLARTTCPGKYVALVGGEVADVTASVEAGIACAGHGIVDHFVIPNIDETVFPAISGGVPVDRLQALGIVETFSIASAIEAADAAVKTASVTLIEVRLAMALGGKAYVTFTGEVAAVENAAQAAANAAGVKGLLADKVVIAQPRQELLREMI